MTARVPASAHTPALARALALVCVAVWALAGCGPGGPASAAQADSAQTDSTAVPGRHYELTVKVVSTRGLMTITSNGLPVWREPRFVSTTANVFRQPLGPGLVSGRNEAAFRVQPQLRRGGSAGPSGYGRELVVPGQRFALRVWGGQGLQSSVGAYVEGTHVPEEAVAEALVRWEAEIQRRWARWLAAEDSAYAAGSPAGPSAGAEWDEFGPALHAAWRWARDHPFEVATSWERAVGPDGRPADGGPAFDGLLRDGPVIRGTAADSARMRDYAVRLLALAVEDPAAFWSELAPAVRDGVEQVRPGAGPAARDSVVSVRVGAAEPWVGLVPFTASDVALRSWAGGRVWELYVPGQEGLLMSRRPPPDRPGVYGTSTVYLGAFVGLVDGELRVVRMNP